MLNNDVHDSKIKPHGIPIGSFTMPKVAANAQEHEDIETIDEESSEVDEELIIINDEGGEKFDMEDEEHKENNGTTIDNNPDDV